MNSSFNSFLIGIATLMFINSSLSAELITKGKNEELVKRSQEFNPKYISYLTSWQLPTNATELLLKSKADAYMISFAKWDKQGVISSSDDVIRKPSKELSHIPRGYLTWTQIAHQNPSAKMIVSFGGQDYEGIWDTMGDEDHSEKIAKNIADLLKTDFPVYQERSSIECDGYDCKEKYQLVGHTQSVSYTHLTLPTKA